MGIELPRPDRDRLSTLTALVLIAYTLVRIVAIPTVFTEISIFGLLVRFELNTQIVMLSLAAGLAVAGTEWLLRSHPGLDLRRRTIEHWIFPGLAAFGIGAIVIRLPAGPALALGLVLAAGLLMSILLAEFIVIFAADPRRDAAAIGLRILAYFLLIESIFAVRAVDMRAFFAVPLIFVVATSVAWRLFKLGRVRQTTWLYAVVVGWTTAQIAWGLHYWPLDPLVAALILGLTGYIANGLLLSFLQESFELVRAVEYGLLGALGLAAIIALT